MPIVTFDGINRVIKINPGELDVDVRVDLYSDWKEWVRQSDNAKFVKAFETVGGNPLGATTTLGRYYFLTNGWKLQTDSGQTGELALDGNIFADDSSNIFSASVPVVRQPPDIRQDQQTYPDYRLARGCAFGLSSIDHHEQQPRHLLPVLSVSEMSPRNRRQHQDRSAHSSVACPG